MREINPMRKLVLGAGCALTAAFGASLGLTSAVEARPTNAELPFQIAQFSDPFGTPAPAAADTLTPNTTLEPITEAADYYAFVESFDGQTLYARLPDGTVEPFTFPEGVGGVDYNLNPGDLVAVNADKNNVISGLDTPVVGEEKIGSVSSLTANPGGQGFNLTGQTSAGDTFDANISEEVASRLQLAEGDEVKVTYFNNIEGLASVCKIKRGPYVAPPAAQPIIPEPVQPIIPPAPVVEGLW